MVNQMVGKRKQTWNVLRWLSDMSNLPWLCMGDFNNILSTKEKMGGLTISPYRIQDFRESIQYARLLDLGFSSYNYTWYKKEPILILFRLDWTEPLLTVLGVFFFLLLLSSISNAFTPITTPYT